MSLAMDASPDGKAYRFLLMKTSDSLSKSNITTIKFLCSDIIGASRLECIKKGIGIWTELENRCLMSSSDYSLLVELLYHAERLDLIRQLTNTDPREVGTMIKLGQSQLTAFRVFLCKFCKQIPQRELDIIKYLFVEDLSSSAREGAGDIWTLLLLLERSDRLGPSNLECLNEIANSINRPDLQEMICQYKLNHQDEDMIPYNEEKLGDTDDSMLDLRSTTHEQINDESLIQMSAGSGHSSSQYSHQSTESGQQSGYQSNGYQSNGYQSGQLTGERLTTPIQVSEEFTELSSSSDQSLGSSYVHGSTTSVEQEQQMSHTTETSAAAGGVDMDQTQGSAHTFSSHGSSNHTGNQIAQPFPQEGNRITASVSHAGNNMGQEFNNVTYEEQFNNSMDIQPHRPTGIQDDLSSRLQSDQAMPQPVRAQQLSPHHVQAAAGATAGTSRESQAQAAILDDDEAEVSLLPEYKMDSRPRGFCLIINNEKFQHVAGDKKSRKLENRPGSEVDAATLEEEFTRLGFEVIRYTNCPESKMEIVFKSITTHPDLVRHNAIVVCVLSHGKMGTVYDSKGYEVKIGQIVGHFKPDNCPALAHKPKMFFIQACQGKNKQQVSSVPSKLHTDDATVGEDDDLPKDADFFIGYATVPGYVSYRHEDDGSWFISTLVKGLHKYAAKYDLLSIMTEVNRGVAKQSAKEGSEVFKQMPLPYTTLTKKIFFNPNINT